MCRNILLIVIASFMIACSGGSDSSGSGSMHASQTANITTVPAGDSIAITVVITNDADSIGTAYLTPIYTLDGFTYNLPNRTIEVQPHASISFTDTITNTWDGPDAAPVQYGLGGYFNDKQFPLQTIDLIFEPAPPSAIN